MTDLAAWLLAVIDNDEWNARQDRVSAEVDGWEWYVLRVLAECAAKRAIVEETMERSAEHRGPAATWVNLILGPLAEPYRDREGWLPEWACSPPLTG